MSEGSFILVVDDVAEARMLICKILQSKGFRTMEAGTGAEAIQAVENHPELDLVLLDIMLPDIDGYEVMEKIARFKEERNLKVLFVSGKKDKPGVIKALQLGGDDYLVKPIYPDALLGKISVILGKDEISEGYNKVRCAFRARLVNSKIQPDINVTELTEMTMLLRATAGFEEEMQIELDGKKLRKVLQQDGSLTLIVTACKRESLGKYFVRCRFVGLPEATCQQIRSLAIRGKLVT